MHTHYVVEVVENAIENNFIDISCPSSCHRKARRCLNAGSYRSQCSDWSKKEVGVRR